MPAWPVISRVALCGAGAVGSAYASRLHALDPSILTVLASGERRERLLRQGLTVNGERFDVRCAGPGREGEPADLVLVAVKHHHLEAAIADLRPAVGDRTIIISLLNGVASEAILGRAFGAEKILPAFVVGSDMVREGSQTRYTRLGQLVFGAPSKDPSDPRVAAVKDLLDRAQITAVVPADILREQWWKFMLNVGVNQVSALLRAPYGAFREPQVQALVRRAALEVVALSAHEGAALGPEDVERIFPVLATLSPSGKTSMLQDVEAGRETEVEIFAGTVSELGRRHGVPTPVNDLLGALIRALEAASPRPG